MSKQVIEPYTFQCKTNIEEHNDIVNKVNEIVDVVNGLNVEEITKDISALESEVSAQGNEIDALDAEIAGLPTKTEVANGDVTAVAVDKTTQGIEIQLTRPAGVLEDSVPLPFINTATLIPTSTERAFKIRFTYTDGTQYDTNEFVIPEGGGTDVSVTGVTVEDGTAPNSFKVAIQLSDASTIASNDYEIDIPAQQNTYPTSVSGTLSGTTLNLTIGLNNSTNVQGTADLSAFLTKSEASTTYATKTEVTAVDTKVDAIGVTSEGNNVTVNGSNATIVKSVSGQVQDGNLKITVNGVESGDIPLPDTINLPTITYNGAFSKGYTKSPIMTTPLTLTATKASAYNVVYDFYTTILQSGNEAYNNLSRNKIRYVGETPAYSAGFSLTTTTRYTEILSSIDSFRVQLVNSSNPVKMALEDGTYKMPILQLLEMGIGGSRGRVISRKINTEIPDTEYITFSISNGIATFDTQTPIQLNANNFSLNETYNNTVSHYISMFADQIIKVN